MAKKTSYNASKIKDVEDGIPFAMLGLDLLNSEAWRTQSVHCMRLIHFLIREHLRHKGVMNGELIATYNQLEEYGIGRRFIAGAIHEGEKRGLLRVERGMRVSPTLSYPNRFTLTFLRERRRDEWGCDYWTVPTNEWRRCEVAVKKSNKRCAKSEPSECTKMHSAGSPSDTASVVNIKEFKGHVRSV